MANLRRFFPIHQPTSILVFVVLQLSFVAVQLVAHGWAALIGGLIWLAFTYMIARRNTYVWRISILLLVILVFFGIPFYVFAVSDHSDREMWWLFIHLPVSLMLLLLPVSRRWFDGASQAP